jgi:hypothetical protein
MEASTDEAKPQDVATATTGSSAWAPFRSPDFDRMASAQFISNVGGWMQTVGAQQLMLTLTTSATLVALIQTAAGLPVVLLAVPAGAIGDLVDRRRLLIASQSFMLLAAVVLAALALAGLVTPLILLALRRRADADLTHVADASARARRAGGPNTSDRTRTRRRQYEPQPGGRPRDRRRTVCGHQRRGVVPGQRGELLAGHRRGRSLARRARPASAVAREHVGEAMRAGARYVAASPALRVILLRAGLFMLFANAIWALLPLIAHMRLHLGAGGYGLLLGGVGGVAGAAGLPRLRGRVTAAALMTSSTLILAGVTLALAYAQVAALAGWRW